MHVTDRPSEVSHRSSCGPSCCAPLSGAPRATASLRDSLDALGDWDEVSSLVQQTVRKGTGAARQRRAYERAGRLEDVVDLIVAETSAL